MVDGFLNAAKTVERQDAREIASKCMKHEAEKREGCKNQRTNDCGIEEKRRSKPLNQFVIAPNNTDWKPRVPEQNQLSENERREEIAHCLIGESI
jgi:hypothetical protein